MNGNRLNHETKTFCQGLLGMVLWCKTDHLSDIEAAMVSNNAYGLIAWADLGMEHTISDIRLLMYPMNELLEVLNCPRASIHERLMSLNGRERLMAYNKLKNRFEELGWM